MDLSLYKDTFDHFSELLPLNAKVLELGCGPGNVIKYLTAKRSDLDILGIDLAPEMIKEAERQNPHAGFKIMDIADVNQLNQQFDAIIAAFCLPYLSYESVDALFSNIENLTTKNALLYLSFMEGTKERSGFETTSFTGDDQLYINYYQQNEIESKLNEHHFNIIALYHKDYPELDGSVTIDLIYIAKKAK